MTIDMGTTDVGALRYSARAAVLDIETSSYVEDLNRKHLWLDNVRFGSIETARTVLEQHGVEVAWIVDGVTNEETLIHVDQSISEL